MTKANIYSTAGVKVPYQKIDESLDLALEAILVICKDHDNVGSIITPIISNRANLA